MANFYRHPIQPLPDPSTLPFPGNIIRECEDCGLRAGCKAPVPAEHVFPCEIMLTGEAPGCFPAGTFVSTPSGVADISTLSVGDSVLGRQGQTQTVKSTFQKQTDRLVTLKIRGQSVLSLTPNHPVLIVRPSRCYDNHTRLFCFPCSRTDCPQKEYLYYVPQWVPAGDVQFGDHVVVPHLSLSGNNDSSYHLPFTQLDSFRKTKFKHRNSETGFKLDECLAYILGWFMAEGTADIKHGIVSFIMGEGDGNLRDDLADKCRKVFGIDVTWIVKGKSYRMDLYSRPLAAWFIDLFGGIQTVRHIPNCIFTGGTSVAKHFIRGWYLGDGKHMKNGHSDGIVTASRAAAYGLLNLILRLGVCPTLRSERWKGKDGRTQGRDNRILGGYSVAFPAKTMRWDKERNNVVFGDNRLLRVDSVKIVEGNCTVYNIETEDNTYLVPFVVHNSQEDEWGYRPFCGQAGTYLDSLLFQSGISRDNVCTTNVCRCRPPNNRTPKPAEIKSCAKWLDIEISIVQPRIIVAMGATAIERFLGSGAGTVEHLHGKPIEVVIAGKTRIILPSYHPAAALHDTAKLRQCADDFKVLRGLAKGIPASEYQIVDEYPNPVYQVADTDAKLKEMFQEIEDAGEYAVDTETCRGKLWSAQFSSKPGTAWFVLVDKLPPEYWDGNRIDLRNINALAIVHNYLFDVQYLSLHDDRFVDSMVMAYLSGQAQGLKELASRLCGVTMKNYSEVVRPGQQKISLSYLNKASKRQWSDPPAIEETKWDNKAGKLMTKAKKPWHISRKINKIISDFQVDNGVDLYDRWKQVPPEERAEVESILGVMPESSLMDIPFADAILYASRDADTTLRVYHKLQKMVEDLGLGFVLNVDNRALPEVYDMMRNGMPVDVPYLQGLSAYYGAGMVAAAERCASIAGHPFNPSSSVQVAAVVYQELGFKATKKTDTGLICTDDQELKKVKHPIIKEILEYRRLLKNKSTFSDALAEHAIPHQQGSGTVYRVHTTLKVTRTETGRLSSADPINLQTMPTRSEEGKKIRKGFRSSPGYRFLAGDFSQQELRLQAHEAKCRNLLDCYRNNIDVHTATAARIFGVSMDDAQKSRYRYPAKTLNFSIIYLVSAKGLNESIHEQALDIIVDGKPLDVSEWTEQSCQKLIDDWYKLNPEVHDWQMEKIAEARRFGYVKDIFGRLRFVPEVSCPIKTIQETGERMCVNFPIQGGCASITKLAMIESWDSRNKLYSTDDIRFIMAIHDELMLEVREGLVMEAAKWLKHIMDNVVTLAIPMISEIKSGENWAEMEKIKL